MADTIDVKDANGDVLPVATNDAIVASVNAVKASVDTLDGSVDAVKTSVDAVKTSVDTLDGSVDAVKASVDAGNALLTTQAGMIDGLEALLTAIGVIMDAANTRAVATLGAKTVAQSPAVNIAIDQPAIPVNQTSSAHDVTLPVTRPADTIAYLAGDVVGGPLTFAGAGKASGAPVLLTGVQFQMNVSAPPSGMGAFRLHFYNVTPPSALADNAPFDIQAGDRSAYLGFVDITTPPDLGSTLYIEVNNINKQMKLLSGSVFAYLQTMSAWTGGSGDVYPVTIHTVEV